MASPRSVLAFLNTAAQRGERTALIALARVEGGAARGVGTLMGVTEGGDWIGSLSGGCIDASMAAEAQRVIASGKAEVLRIGAGSPMIDIRLPCGSAMDLLLLPDPDAGAVAQACALLSARHAVTLHLGSDGSFTARECAAGDATGWDEASLAIRVIPQMRLLIAGHGEEVPALAPLARAWGAETLVLTPDERTAHLAGGDAVLLKTPSEHPALALDAWSALVMLFHDHDWEAALLAQAVRQEALFIGAMGSRKTHALRLETLAAVGVSDDLAARVKGPIGLIPSSRDPQTMALSVLAEVVTAYNAA